MTKEYKGLEKEKIELSKGSSIEEKEQLKLKEEIKRQKLELKEIEIEYNHYSEAEEGESLPSLSGGEQFENKSLIEEK